MSTEPLDLDAAKAREAAATPGPWLLDESHSVVTGTGTRIVCSVGMHTRLYPSPADGEFIAAARQDVPALLAEVDRLRYERQLLGAARSLLDEVASGDVAWFRVRRQAEDLAQRIVDEIGHPVTDEPALGPSFREQLEHLRATSERFTDPSVTEAIAREIEAAKAAPGDPPCCFGPDQPCAGHIAEHLVNAMRESRLVVLTVDAADAVIRHVEESTHGA